MTPFSAAKHLSYDSEKAFLLSERFLLRSDGKVSFFFTGELMALPGGGTTSGIGFVPAQGHFG